MKGNSSVLPAITASVALELNRNIEVKKNLELRHRFEIKRSCRGVRSVNITNNNRYLIITFEEYAKIRVLDLEKLEFLPHEYNGHTASVRLTSITRDNQYFHTASWDGSSRRYEIASGKCTQVFSGFGRSPSCFVAEEKYLFTASYESDKDLDSVNTGRCWNLASGKVIQLYKHTEARKTTECIDIAYDQEFIYTGSDDGQAFQWNLKGEKPILKYFECEGSVRKIAISKKYLTAACTDGFIRVHDKHSGKSFWCFEHGNTDVREVRITSDETKCFSAAEDGTVCCFNLVSGELIYKRKIHSLHIWSICLMPDEKVIVTGSGDGSIVFMAAASGKILVRLMNLPWDNEILLSCPPDKAFPSGFFYTTNRDFIQVVAMDKNRIIKEIMELDDPRREAYIDKLNLKNLVINKFKSNSLYKKMTDNYLKQKNKLNGVNKNKSPRLLKA